jgi:hypothetical protein
MGASLTGATQNNACDLVLTIWCDSRPSWDRSVSNGAGPFEAKGGGVGRCTAFTSKQIGYKSFYKGANRLSEKETWVMRGYTALVLTFVRLILRVHALQVTRTRMCGALGKCMNTTRCQRRRALTQESISCMNMSLMARE